jgi:hypothetical protein
MVDDINTGSACAAEKCTHHSHSGLLDDADAAAEAKERALLAELAAARAEREAAIAESHELRTHLLSLYNCVKHLAPYPPEVAEGVVAIMDVVRAALSAAPPREERLAALGFEHPKPGSGTVGELIGLKPMEEIEQDFEPAPRPCPACGQGILRGAK